MDTNKAILAALEKLDPENDEHWTSDGLPRVDVVANLSGHKQVQRAEITSTAPKFTRESAKAPTVGDEAKDEDTDESSEPTGDDGDRNETPEESRETDEAPTAGDEGATTAGPEVDPEAVVLDMPFAEVMASPELLERTIHALDRKTVALRKQRAEIDGAIAELSKKSEIAMRQLDRLRGARPGSDTQNIRDYLARQKEVREGRLDRARRFVEAGTTAADVNEQLRTGSKLDAALNQRKPGLGQARPAPRTPAQHTS